METPVITGISVLEEKKILLKKRSKYDKYH
jgi:hypothetical protein